MTKYLITAPEARFNGDLAGLVFRAGKAHAEIPADLAAVTYCQRRGYSVVAVDSDGDPLPEGEQPGDDTLGSDVVGNDDPTVPPEVKRPANYAAKPEWVAYAVARGATEDDAKSATKDELVELYGSN